LTLLTGCRKTDESRHVIIPTLNVVAIPFSLQIPAWGIAVSAQFLYLPMMLRRAFDYPW
jgi:hypothetical protein